MPCANCTCQGKTPSDCTSRVDVGASVSLRNAATTKTGERTRLWKTTANDDADAAAASTSGESSAQARSSYGATDDASEGETENLLPASLVPKCEKHNGVRGVCCRDLKRNQASVQLIDPDIVRDVIIGLSDGLTVPFALTAGLSGVGSTRIVVLAGLAELVSGAISMGVGGALSAQAELSHYRYVQRSTQQRVRISCSGELEREVCDILQPFGVPADVSALVAAKLQSVEQAEDEQDQLPTPVTAPPVRRSDGLVGPERGLTPFLLRLGEGMEEIEASRVWQSALVIGSSYFVGGFIPLLPYILLASVQRALLLSIVVTGIVLLIFGVVKQKCTGGQSDARGLLWGGFSTLFVGAAAAGSSWVIVRALEGGSA